MRPPFVISFLLIACFYGFWGFVSEVFSRRLFGVSFISGFVLFYYLQSSVSDSGFE